MSSEPPMRAAAAWTRSSRCCARESAAVPPGDGSAVNHYTAIFDDARVLDVHRYSDAGPGEPGSVMTITFELAGQEFIALNGGPQFPFTEAVSLSVDCASQEEVDRFWMRLTDGGEEGPCGWLKDKFGLSWQIVPRKLTELLGDPDPVKSQRVMEALFGMKKINIQSLMDAAEQ
ncbi:VOC family protein [Streptomyces sp. A3M-1-3]|uniref:VOC family protein n=1 Tax=Streptomyces sp. A3M-1-3 TaxID=2962044 RepID=UPI0020B788B0|nr:VOC family protein [Streptomyces sp. A3M-1-3]MCP3820018.1 VOC family protein [Streptomyces sp. A3M-1-3]